MATSPYYRRFLELEAQRDHDHDSKKKNLDHDHESVRKPEKRSIPLFKVVNQDERFQLAQSWGAYPQALYKACERHGIERVRTAIEFVASVDKVKCRSRYLFAVLKNGGGA